MGPTNSWTASYGYRNRDHLKTAIFFHCGGLDLYPAPGSKNA